MNLSCKQLKDHPHYLKALVELVESSFQYPKEHKVTVDFAPLYSPTNTQRNLLFFNQEQTLIGHIGLMPRTLKFNNEQFPIILLGGICVHKDHRGKGHLNEIIQFALSEIKDKYALALLWSDLSELYNKFHFYEAGEVVQTGQKVLDHCPHGFKKVKPNQCPPQTLDWIQKVYDKRDQNDLYIMRTANDWHELLKSSSIELYYNDMSQEYFMMNKGYDLPGIIHEYGPMNSRNLMNIISPYKVWTHPKKITDRTNHSTSFYLSFMKLGGLGYTQKLFHALSNGKINITEIDSSKVSFDYYKKSYQLDHEVFLKGFFGPSQLEEFKEFSITFTIAGVDSI